MLKRVESYREFCNLAEKNLIVVEVKSSQGKEAIKTLRDVGWEISYVQPAKDIVQTCLSSLQKFDIAYKQAEVSFWAKN